MELIAISVAILLLAAFAMFKWGGKAFETESEKEKADEAIEQNDQMRGPLATDDEFINAAGVREADQDR